MFELLFFLFFRKFKSFVNIDSGDIDYCSFINSK